MAPYALGILCLQLGARIGKPGLRILMIKQCFQSPSVQQPHPCTRRTLSYYINSHVNANRNPSLESPDPQSGFPLNISTLEAFSSFPPIPEATALILHHFHLAFAEISKRYALFILIFQSYPIYPLCCTSLLLKNKQVLSTPILT